jgi:hypothetical protein
MESTHKPVSNDKARNAPRDQVAGNIDPLSERDYFDSVPSADVADKLLELVLSAVITRYRVDRAPDFFKCLDFHFCHPPAKHFLNNKDLPT